MTAAPHTLRLALGPSRGLAAVLVCAHLAAVSVVWSAQLPLVWTLGFKLAVAASLAWTTWAAALRRAPRAVVVLELDADGAVRALLRSGTWIECQVAGSTFVSAPLTVLNLRSRSGIRTRAVVIPADSAPADELRALRVWLRWRMNPAATGPSGP